ncbi:hypothetical protein QCA50_010572 [Cerrena zonata]|uniref:Uncharacterized protein n=1 Tax=Cerrena zonata TaxID=2478898 RepID=A0AAW0FXW2_9APHY
MVKLVIPLYPDPSSMPQGVSSRVLSVEGGNGKPAKGRQDTFSAIEVLLNDVSTTFNTIEAHTPTCLLSSTPTPNNDPSPPTPNPDINIADQPVECPETPAISPPHVSQSAESPAPSIRKYPETRRGDRLKMARKALENWRNIHWRDKYSNPNFGPQALLPNCALRKLATKASLRTVAQIKAAVRWDWAEEYMSEVLKVLDDSDASWRAGNDRAIKERKENRAKTSAQNKIIREERRRQEVFIERRLKKDPRAGLPEGETIGFPFPPLATSPPSLPYALPPHTPFASSSAHGPQMTVPAYPHPPPSLTYDTQDTSAPSRPSSAHLAKEMYPAGYYWAYGWVPMSMPVAAPTYDNPKYGNQLPPAS